MRPTLAVLVAVALVVALALPRADEIRGRAEAGLGRGMPPREAELARGFVLGQDEGIDAATEEDFRRSGLSHLLAVSGQNVTLLALLAIPLLAALGIPLRARLLWVLGLIAVYVPLTGAGPSIQRAAVMGAAGILATLAGRRTSRLYALALAAGVTLAIDPAIGADVGWQLSFAAVLGILLLATPLREALVARLGGRGWQRALAEGVAVTVAATLATAPLIAFHFGTFSTTSLAANVLALPAVAPAMWLGMASAAGSQVPGFPVELLNVPASVLLAYIAQVAAWCAAPEWAELEVHLGGKGLIAAYGALAAGASGLGALRRASRRRVCSWWPIAPPRADSRVRLAALAVIASLAGAVWWWTGGSSGAEAPVRGLRITVLDVGQGDAILLQPAHAPAVLVDGGPPGAGLAAKLDEAGVESLGAAVASHDQSDHVGGLEELFGAFPVARLLYGRLGREPLALARAAGAATVQVGRGTTIRSGRLRLEFVWPPPELLAEPQPGVDPNQLALVAVARWRGFAMLLTADAEAEAVPLDPGRLDVLKVAHHGSDDAGLAALLERTRPALAVISVGAGNPYGHPTPTTLATLAAAGVPVLRTDESGSVEIEVDRGLTRLEAVAAEMKPLYLIAGTDMAKIDATRSRLRARAEGEGGTAALEVFEPGEGRGMPDYEALLNAIPAMSLMDSRRYLLADGVEKWRDKQLEAVAASVAALPPDLTLVLIARAKAPAKLLKAVKAAKGEVHEFEAPKARDMPRVLVADAQKLGFRLEPAAARVLVDRMGASPVRLHNELERLAIWAGAGGEVSAADLDEMIADTSEAVVWSLSDALIEGNAPLALRIGEQLIGQGENVTGLIYGLASRLRQACAAAAKLEEGMAPAQVESSLKMHPYAAKQLVRRLRDADLEDLRQATEALAELELWCRGEADYGDELALTLALRRAAGVAV